MSRPIVGVFPPDDTVRPLRFTACAEPVDQTYLNTRKHALPPWEYAVDLVREMRERLDNDTRTQ